MAPKFGTSGLRGLVTDLTDEVCAAHVAAFLRGVGDGPRQVLVAGDLRPSTARIMDAVTAGAARAGVAAVDCGRVPTPALALAAMRAGVPAVMVTGSHIPADRNGLKFYTARGEITKNDEAGILSRLRDDEVSGPAAFADTRDVLSPYLSRYVDWAGAGALTGLRIGHYEHSSVARDALGLLLSRLGAEVVPLGRADGFVPVDTEAVDAATRARLADWAAATRLDAIVSTDGDADRPLLTDAAGRVVPGDVLGPVTARALGAAFVVTPVSSNTLVEAMAVFDGVVRTRIGSPHVIAGMTGAGGRVVGYEANGGVLLGFDAEGLAPLPTRDAVLPIVAVLRAARGHPGGVAGVVADLPARVTATDRLQDVPTAVTAGLVADLTARAGSVAALIGRRGEAARDLTDGLRVTLEDGDIVHLRPSGNAPELRVYVETADADAAAALLRAMLAAVARRLDRIPAGH